MPEVYSLKQAMRIITKVPDAKLNVIDTPTKLSKDYIKHRISDLEDGQLNLLIKYLTTEDAKLFQRYVTIQSELLAHYKQLIRSYDEAYRT